MNLLNLEVKIKKIKIKTNQQSALSFSLRLGRLLSQMGPSIMNKSNTAIQLNVDLNIGCEDNIINSNSRACLVIYELGSTQHRDIVGMVFILLKNAQGETQRYRIQQCSDPHSFVQLSFSITNLEVQQKQNQSFVSKSSLAQIKQLHRVLSRGHKKSGSDVSYDADQQKKMRLSPQQKERQPRNRNPNKVSHIKSQQSAPFRNDENEVNYTLILKKLELQLTKERQRNSVLTNLLVIQQAKNNQSEKVLSSIISTFKKTLSSQNSKKQKYTQSFITNISNTLQKKQFCVDKQNNEIQKLQIRRQQSTINSNSIQKQTSKFEAITKERDQLYKISQQLYEKTKVYKKQNQNLFKNAKNLQNQLKLCIQEIQDLKQQNIDMKTKIFEMQEQKSLSQPGQSQKLHQLLQQNEKMKKQNIQYERKFKQSYRAIQQFKNDAWKAQQQIIVKDKEITLLKQQLQSLRALENKHNQRSESGSYMSKDEKQQKKSNADLFKFMSALMMKNNIDRQMVLNRLDKVRQTPESNRVETVQIINQIKEKMTKIYQQYDRQNIKTILVLEMKRKFMIALNQLNF